MLRQTVSFVFSIFISTELELGCIQDTQDTPLHIIFTRILVITTWSLRLWYSIYFLFLIDLE